ncbi:unnamed protein product [Phytophthora fragariaefolia]|uniref:Unnamed protein product n=1 Tax=Phytophthora fragariaefolia TaxID=1490495 RepID=A0A9W6Y8S6_9STRA|nr:unnamed protein product [Phytophthora fragariaefolia]
MTIPGIATGRVAARQRAMALSAQHMHPAVHATPPAEVARGAAASYFSAQTLTTERIVREKCEPNQKTQIRSDLRGSRSVKGDAGMSTVVDTQVEQEWSVTERSDLGASAREADAIGPNTKGRSAVRRRGRRGASAPGADAASSADGCKRPEPEMLACSRAAGDQKKDLSTAGPGQNKTRGVRFRTRSERRKRSKLRKSRSGTETLQAASAGQTQRRETTVETLSVLTRTDTGLQYRKMALESPPTLASELTSLVECGLCMLEHAGLSKSYWGKAVVTATFLRNRCPTRSTTHDKSPHQVWTGKKTLLANLKVFGCHAYVTVPKKETYQI